jgi:NAD+ kinase
VVRALRRAGVPLLLLGRAGLQAVPAASLVVTVGGDGTFLRAAHFLRATPMLGVNSDPRHSRGAFCCCTGGTFAATLERWLRGRAPVVPLHRLAVAINGRRVREPVLNDLLVTHGNPAATARYVLQAGRRTEEQLSSGLWVATAAGSTGAALSAGGCVLPLSSHRIQFVVREPYPAQRVRYRLTEGTMPPGAVLSVTALVPGMAIYLDGPAVRYPLAFGDRCVVGDARLPLQAVGVTRQNK